MMSTRIRAVLGAALVAAGLVLTGGSLRAQEIAYLSDDSVISTSFDSVYGCRPWEYGRPDLFYNFYVPNDCGGVPAQLYIAPRPVPPLVGHTYYTYQPFMPHEFTYPHYRHYRRYYDDGRGMTRTSAAWYRSPTTLAVHGIRETFRLAR